MKFFEYFLVLCMGMCGAAEYSPEMRHLTPEQLQADLASHQGKVVDVAIIGGGPAGMAAAFGIAHRQRRVALFMGDRPGGQVMGSHMVDNLPATPPQHGPEFVEMLTKRLEGVYVMRSEYDPVMKIEMREISGLFYFLLTTRSEEQWLAFGVVIATGGEDKRLQVLGEELYWDKQVFTCVSCASIRARRSKQVYVVGGGDASIDMIMDLLDLVPRCTLLVRAASMRATPAMQKRIAGDHRVTIRYQRSIKRMQGDAEGMKELVLVDPQGVEEIVPADCVFLAIGKNPATAWLTDALHNMHVACDATGYIEVDGMGRTSVPCMYAVGDVAFPTHLDHQIDLGMALARVRTARSLLYDINCQGIFAPGFQRELMPYYWSA
jgi:thioredoxin reductase (NADPH)